MAKVQRKSVSKGKKKKWFKIIAPKSFNNQVLGESYIYDSKQLLGKNLKVNMMTLSRDPKQQHLNLSFEIKQIDGDKGLTRLKGFEISPAFLKRIVRRGKNRVDMSFTCRTKDKLVRVKPIILTRSLTHNPVLTSLRESTVHLVTKTFANYQFEDVIKDLLAYKIQRQIKEDLKKIYPLKSFDIRVIKEEIGRRKEVKVEEPIAGVSETKETKIKVEPKTEDKKEEAEKKDPTVKTIKKPDTEESAETNKEDIKTTEIKTAGKEEKEEV